MKNELKQKWLEALRSGKYAQGVGFLRSGDNFCCLGVLCDISGKQWIGDEDGQYSTADAPEEWSLLNHDTQAEFGLAEDQMFALTQMNDRGKTFTEIADHIEKSI